MTSFQSRLLGTVDRRLDEVEQFRAALENDTYNIHAGYRSLQSENTQLKEDVKYLSSKCEELEQELRKP